MPLIFLNYGLAFIEGLALIVSPCILPILPILLSGTITGGKRRPLGVVCGFVIVFALFTLFSRSLVQHLNFNLDVIRQVAYGLIVVFGIVLFSDYLSEKFNTWTQRIATIGASYTPNADKNGFVSGLILGALISLVWVPCGGPILAAAIVQTAVQQTTWQGFLTFFCFALGSAVPMLLIALLGRKLASSLNFLKSRTRLLRKIFAVIMVLAAMIAALADRFALYSTMPEAPNVLPPEVATSNKLVKGLSRPYPAPSLQNVTAWINSAPLNLTELKGKVVLVDFWTYSCINCVRTLPYLKDWYDKYQRYGLVIIGVHTPEFEFEKKLANVTAAVEKDGIRYPVALDNDYGTWLNYHNSYWPADYLIDKNGMVVYQHNGEGDYAEAEHNIRVLLGLQPMQSSEVKPETAAFAYGQTPETYFGYARAENFNGPQPLLHDQIANYIFPATLPKDGWALQGQWNVQAEKITAVAEGASIKLHFYAKKVFVVAGSEDNKPIMIKVLLNGNPIQQGAGKDVDKSILHLAGQTIYEVVALPDAQAATLELKVMAPGAQFYTFTFGG